MCMCLKNSPMRKLEVNPPTTFGCPNTFTIIFSPLSLRTPEISSVGGVWIFSGTSQYCNNNIHVHVA